MRNDLDHWNFDRHAGSSARVLLAANDPYPRRGRARLSPTDISILKALASCQGLTPQEVVSRLLAAEAERVFSIPSFPSPVPQAPHQSAAAGTARHGNSSGEILP